VLGVAATLVLTPPPFPRIGSICKCAETCHGPKTTQKSRAHILECFASREGTVGHPPCNIIEGKLFPPELVVVAFFQHLLLLALIELSAQSR
jgi:hypothetical protein